MGTVDDNFQTIEMPIELKFGYIVVFGKSLDHVEPLDSSNHEIRTVKNVVISS